MQQNDFLNCLNEQDFPQALELFNKLTNEQQIDLLKQLHYQTREAKTPIAVSVLYRELHEDKTFEDFHNAWMPPQEAMQPIKVGDKLYYQFFDTPVRVINAVSMENPKEIVSIGLVWANSEEEFKKGLEKATQDKNNSLRGDNIGTVATKISAKIYTVSSDTNLGN